MTAQPGTTLPRFLSDYQVAEQRVLLSKFRQLWKQEIDRNEEDSTYSVAVGSSREMRDFNRYTDILPFNRNRVILQQSRPKKTDYINASYVEAPGNVRRYIAAQGPLDNTIDDFWLMVWEQRSNVIVMLTKELENGRVKCAKYWPTDKDTPLYCADNGIRVSLVSVTARLDRKWVERTFQLSKGNRNSEIAETRQVTQLHFVGWPDHGVPESPDLILALVERTNELQEQYRINDAGVGRMVVHCSAGCGRTGSFCTVDSALALLPTMQDDGLDLIYHLVEHFRKQRTAMVQTPGQYQFCYAAILYKVMSENRSQ